MVETAYPIAGPAVSGDQITVSTMLNEPTRITRYLSEINLQSFIAPRIFSSPGGVSGGAVIYDQLTLNDLYPDREIQVVAPGAEFPEITHSQSAPKVATVHKQGGKFFVTDEARDRNQLSDIQVKGRKLINTITRKIDKDALTVLAAVMADPAYSSQTIGGTDWNSVVTSGTSQSTAAEWPAADFAAAQLKADTQELGVGFDLWIVNPAQLAQFSLVYGPNWRQILAAYELEMLASNRVTAGTAWVVESGQVGELRLEKALSTETWREPETQRTWVQSDVRLTAYVTNPYSVLKVTGLAGA